ncbi:MAG: hypothetical protein SVU32_00425 [Candidatus Nanohaloarchaea archaeon]|nr:hypothetical protein [Candidatus Nanohaloarchaea archaeon]
MTLSVTQSFRDGLQKLASPNGVTVLGVFFFLQLANAAFLGSIRSETMGVWDWLRLTPAAVSMDLPLLVAGAGAVVSLAATFAVTVVSFRVFVSTEENRIPAELYRQDLLMPAVWLGITGLVYAVLVMLGSLLLVLPGLYLLAAFGLYGVVIANEDVGIGGALRRSWELTDGHRLRVFVVFFLLAVLNLGLQFAGGWFGLQATAVFLSVLGSVTGFAVIGAVYRQARGDDA